MCTINLDNTDKVVILGEELGKVTSEQLQYIDISLIKPNLKQPRKYFDLEKLNELAESIKLYGVLQPIIIQPNGNNSYTIIAGERRWRACAIAGLKEIPSIIRVTHANKEALTIALIENLHRQGLKVTEEAFFYQNFLDSSEYTQEELARVIGKSRSYITNLLRVNGLDISIRDKIDAGIITLGHAKVLVGCQNLNAIVEIIINKNLTVRQTENLIKEYNAIGDAQKAQFISSKLKNVDKNLKSVLTFNSTEKPKKEDLKQIEQTITQIFTLESKINFNGDKGKITLHFNSLNELDSLLAKISSIKEGT
jgi:ParB family chromosome partitioning protein